MADDKYDVLLDFVADTAQAEKSTSSFADTLKDVEAALERGEKIGARAGKAGLDNWQKQKKAASEFQAGMKSQAAIDGERIVKMRQARAELVKNREEAEKLLFQKNQEELINRRNAETIQKQARAEAERIALAEKEQREAEELAKIQAEIAETFKVSTVSKKTETEATRELVKLEKERKAVQGPVAPGLTGLPGINPEISDQAEYITLAAKEMGVEFKQSFEELVKGGKTGEEALESLTAEFKTLFAQTEQGQELMRQQRIQTAQQTASVLRAQASILNTQVAETRRRIDGIRQVSQGLAQVSKIGLGVGVGLVGGAFAFAAKYVRDAKESTTVTLQWKAAQESLARSSARVGEVVARESLPLLLRAVTIAEKAAGFVERNPELVQAAINVGLITAGVSVMGLMVSKGVKLYADVAYLATVPLQLQAARLQAAAATEQLVAARLRAGQGVTNVVGNAAKGGAGILGLGLGPLAAILAGGTAFGALGAKASQVGAKAFGYDSPVQFWEQLFEKIKNSNPVIKDLVDTIKSLGDSSAKTALALPTGVRASPEFEGVLKAYESYLSDQKEMEAKYAGDRTKIIEDANQAISRSNTKYASDIAKAINQRDDAIKKAQDSFAKSEQRAEQDYAIERQKIIREGGEELVKIEADLQETLRKNKIEHEGREQELLAARDAVGLIKERQRFNQQQSEATRDANIEIRQHRADLAQRLEDNRIANDLERSRRLEDHQARLLEIQATAQEQLNEIRKQHAAELREIQINKIARIRELDSQFSEERKRRYNQFLQQIRDLDASLLGEKKLRDRYQAQMITDLDKFLATYRSKLATLSSTGTSGGTKATGGYATYGTYLLGDRAGGGRGKPEYVLGGDVTELAERVLGSKLSQSKLAAMFGSMNSSQRNVTYNDGRRIDSRVSNADRDRLREDAVEAVAQALGVN